MNRRTSKIFILTILISILTVGFLFMSGRRNENYQHASFTRIFSSNLLKNQKVLDVKYNSYYISGVSKTKIYLANSVNPFHLLVIDKSLADTSHVQIMVKDSISYRSIKVAVDSPYFYIADGTMPFIYKGDVKSWIPIELLNESSFFVDMIPISRNGLVFRTISNLQNTFGKKDLGDSFSKMVIYQALLEKQIDGLFCTDGTLLYDASDRALVYIYFYRNQYLYMDTSFSLIRRGNTIDTVSRAKIKVAKISSENAVTMNAPPLLVNKKGSISGSWLFINSNLLSKDENKENFEKASVIDVYNIKKNQYKFSFYLPDEHGKDLKSFVVTDNNLIIALHDQYIVTYDLNMTYFHD